MAPWYIEEQTVQEPDGTLDTFTVTQGATAIVSVDPAMGVVDSSITGVRLPYGKFPRSPLAGL